MLLSLSWPVSASGEVFGLKAPKSPDGGLWQFSPPGSRRIGDSHALDKSARISGFVREIESPDFCLKELDQSKTTKVHLSRNKQFHNQSYNLSWMQICF